MCKQDFLEALRNGLKGLPKQDIEDRIVFYGEMIDDRMEEMSEADAVAAVGSVDDVISEILEDTSIAKLVKEKVRPKRRLRAWEIVLLVLGSPVWFPLAIVFAAVILVIYICLWAVVAALWSVDLALGVASVVFGIEAILSMIKGMLLHALAIGGASVALAGLSMLMFFICLKVSKWMVILIKKMALSIKRIFVGKGNNNE